MITTEEAKEICLLTHLTDFQMCKVIEKYIYDLKKVTVKINRPTDLINIQLMNIAFDSACRYYAK
jgi:hypothetical protein